MQSTMARCLSGLTMAAASLFGAASAQAGYTTIKAPPATEVGQEQIIEHQYGGNWHKVGDDYYCGQMSAKRIDDFLVNSSIMSVNTGECGDATDQSWCAGKLHVSAVAKFSLNSQHLGVDSNGQQTSLLDVSGYGFAIDPASADCVVNSNCFEWVRSGDSGTQYSIDGDNADHRDHLVTYAIEGLSNQKGPVWMMFWEDLDRTPTMSVKRSWADYNDLAVEVRPCVTAIPLPPAGWAGLTTLCGIFLMRGRKALSTVSA